MHAYVSICTFATEVSHGDSTSWHEGDEPVHDSVAELSRHLLHGAPWQSLLDLPGIKK